MKNKRSTLGAIKDAVGAVNRVGPLAALLILCVALHLVTGGRFFTGANISNILRQVPIVSLMALGMLHVILLGGIDLSAGALLAIGICSAGVVMRHELLPMNNFTGVIMTNRPTKCKAAFMHGPFDLRIQDLELPPLKPDQILIKVGACGICGSDVECYEGKSAEGRYDIAPYVPGHEWAGKAVEVGSAVTSVKVGDKVVGDCVLPCHHCANCKDGKMSSA